MLIFDKNLDCCIVFQHWKFMFNEHSKFVFWGTPEMFFAAQNYLSVSSPPKSGRYDDFTLQTHSLYVQVLCSE